MDVFRQTALLKKELDELRPLSKEDEARIMQKFRLDWNYHSNHLEGNSLTYGETKALILFGITAQGKPLKDHFEITGHDEAVKWILDVIKEGRQITENFIRELHKLILKEPYEVDAITPEGNPTKKTITIGAYKTKPNHVKTKTGEVFRFATPEETPAKMNDLMEWYRSEKKSEHLEPILLAAEFHYRFIRIHPFDDGNGRTARILMNFILLQAGYPPVIIKTEDKENYFAALRLADAGQFEPFVEYVANNLIHSLNLMIKGAKGESIEEPDDLNKEIALLKGKFKELENKVEVFRSKESILDLYQNHLKGFMGMFGEMNKKFDDFYDNSEYSISLDGIGYSYDRSDFWEWFNEAISKIPSRLTLWYSFKNLKQRIHKQAYFDSEIKIEFENRNYILTIPNSDIKIKKWYDEWLSKEEEKYIIESEKQRHVEELKKMLPE